MQRLREQIREQNPPQGPHQLGAPQELYSQMLRLQEGKPAQTQTVCQFVN